jgi:hypothetical protein
VDRVLSAGASGAVDVDVAGVDVEVAAGLARECAVMVQAYRLARWVGESPRPVTAGGVLRRSDVAGAGAVLGVAVPEKVRTAADVPALHRPWSVALSAGLLELGGGMVMARPMLQQWPAVDDGALLTGWLAGLRAVCAAESDRRREEREESVAILVHALLRVLAADVPPVGEDLWSAVSSMVDRDDEAYGSFSYRLLSGYLDLATGYPFGGLLAVLGMFGVVTGTSADARTTPLGRWAVARVEADTPRPIDAGLPAGDLVARLAAFGDTEVAWAAVQPWLTARTVVAAAREILAAAVGESPSRRLAAVEVVAGLGEPALPVWEEMVGAADVGPHARVELAAWGRRPAVGAVDRRWLAVEVAAAALADVGPDRALSRVYEDLPGPDLDSRLAAAGGSGHPDGELVARALAEFVASGSPRTVDQVLQLKVVLLRWRPAIWRRVLVPATASLAGLHRVVQVLFGWDGDHLHAFTVGRKRYSEPSYDLAGLEMSNEFEVLLADVFTAAAKRPAVKKIAYEYDFGAGWCHEVVLEKVRARLPELAYPVCVAFQGDSPVEYPFEEDPQDPVAFDLAAVNRRLARTRRNAR